MKDGSFYKQFNYCVSGKVATKRADGVYLCGKFKGECAAIKCQKCHAFVNKS